jgi:hypothetical protein
MSPITGREMAAAAEIIGRDGRSQIFARKRVRRRPTSLEAAPDG